MLQKKYFALVLITVFSIVLLFNNTSYADGAPRVSANATKKSYRPGDQGTLILKFKTGHNVKIPKEPEITVTLTTDLVQGNGLQDYSGGEGDYISNSQVKYNFTVLSDAVSGSSITITGTVKFGYCSSDTGVCKIGNQKFSATIKIK